MHTTRSPMVRGLCLSWIFSQVECKSRLERKLSRIMVAALDSIAPALPAVATRLHPRGSCCHVAFVFSCEVSFDRPPGQEQPSLLDYSQEQGGGPVLGAGSCRSGGERNGGVALHTGETALRAASAMREAHSVGECYSTGISGERINVTGGCGTGGSLEEESGQETYPPHVQTAASGWPASADPENARTTVADNTDAVFPHSSGAEDDMPEAPQGVAGPRKTRKGGDMRCGGGAIGGGGRDSLLDGVAAKVQTRHSPRRKLPAYLSASPNGFGAASRWGALSKAHLEFHRLGTAGQCRELDSLTQL